ncbi:hypothetical protein C2E23DRAFT_934271 [Lenzites betulinus]|nr:hypothetical protein C2E23DRAFT_934271 [Lenzites betulinus]
MEWWTLFRRIRIIIFAFISIVSIAFAAILSVYLSKEWIHFSTLQRAIVLAMIGVNTLTSLLLYLMAVVVFRMWKELLRVLFLLAIHIGAAVPFTLFGFSFSCAIFNPGATCKIVNLTFLSSAWSITGLLLGYTVYLCIMSRVPHPAPLVTLNDLLDTPPVSRATSVVSAHSATRLLSQSAQSTLARPASPASMYSQESTRPRTVPKRLFVANSTPRSSTQTTVSRTEELQRAPSYGATGTETREIEPSILHSRFSTSTMGSTHSVAPALPRSLFSLRVPHSEHLFRRPSAPAAPSVPRPPVEKMPQRIPPRPLLLNPFSDPLSRHGTPETAFSGYSYTSAPANMNVGGYAVPPPFPGPYGQGPAAYGSYLSPYASPSLYSAPQFDRSSTPQTIYTVTGPAQVLPGPPGYAYLAPYAVHYAGAPTRTHAATPSASSIHSMSPSIHFHPTGPAPAHPASLTPAHPANETRAPPAVHLRSASDPVVRTYSADPRVGGRGDGDVMLPNPYAAGAEIRRYGSVPHVRSTGAYVDSVTSGCMGGLTAAAPAEDGRWREAVLKAASAGRG